MLHFADLHFHSKYSRAVSPDMSLDGLNAGAKVKGLTILGTGDFTHPLWFKELKSRLRADEGAPGFFRLDAGDSDSVRFMLTCEVSTLCSTPAGAKKVHHILHVPEMDQVVQINDVLSKRGNLAADGRPMFGKTMPVELVELVRSVSKDVVLVPAHIWTPWFSVFGSKSGFDSMTEAYGDQAKHIFAYETGISSTPAMNWRVSSLDNLTPMSNSDSHCLHPDTLIYLPGKRPRPIKDFQTCEPVLSLDLKGDLKLNAGIPTQVHRRLSPPKLIRVNVGRESIQVTPEHRFFVLRNSEICEVVASNLKVDDLVARVRKLSYAGKTVPLPFYGQFRYFSLSESGLRILREKRLLFKKRQRDVADYLGVYTNHYWKIENGLVSIREDLLMKLCQIFSINSLELLAHHVGDFFPKLSFPTQTTADFCQLLGYVLGDGGYTFKHPEAGLNITDKDSALLDCYRQIAQGLFSGSFIIRKNPGNSNNLELPAAVLHFIQLATDRMIVPSPERRIPGLVFSLPDDQVAAFLRGIFDAEGTVGHHSVSFTSSSRGLSDDVVHLLKRLGISAHPYSDFEKNKKKWRYPVHIYGQDNLRNFQKSVGFCSKPKSIKLEAYLGGLVQKPKASNSDFLPLDELLSSLSRSYSLRRLPPHLRHHLRTPRSLKRINAVELVHFFSTQLAGAGSHAVQLYRRLESFAGSDLIFERITSIQETDSDTLYVYDLTIPAYENYVADAFVVHNSNHPWRLGRECNVFEFSEADDVGDDGADGKKDREVSAVADSGGARKKEKNRAGLADDPVDSNTRSKAPLSFDALWNAVREKDSRHFKFTIETPPEYGKYHWDGHRACNFSCPPLQTRSSNGICPKCRRPLTIGVQYRVEELADRPIGFVPNDAIPFKTLLPLHELLAAVLGVGLAAKKVQLVADRLMAQAGTELGVLLDLPEKDLVAAGGAAVAQAVLSNRAATIAVKPGFDGEYGRPVIEKNA